MSAAALASRTLKPATADARHRFVPDYEDRSSVEKKIGPALGQAVPFLAPLKLCLSLSDQAAALVQCPDIKARIRFDDAIDGDTDVMVIVFKAETAGHECETKARVRLRSSAVTVVGQ